MPRVWVLLAGLLAAAAVLGIPLLGSKHGDSQHEVGEQGFALLRAATADTHPHSACAVRAGADRRQQGASEERWCAAWSS